MRFGTSHSDGGKTLQISDPTILVREQAVIKVTVTDNTGSG